MKLTTQQLKQIIKEELQYLYEAEESINKEGIQQLFRIGMDDFETMRVLMEDTFELKEGKDYVLSNEDKSMIVAFYSDNLDFLELINSSLSGLDGSSIVSYGVNEVADWKMTSVSCKESWRYVVEVFGPHKKHP